MYLPSTLSFCLSYLSFLHCYLVFCQLPHPHSQRGSSESQITMRKPCCDKEGTNKGAWSREEDQKLIDYIRDHGEGRWRFLPKAAGLHRCGKSCRLRWINYLRPDIKRGNFAPDEEDLIIKLHALLGNRWSLIAGRLPGRTDNEVKNYWNSHIRRKLINMGIDPNNHKPHQRFPVPHAHHHVSAASAPSSGSMNKEHRVPFIKSSGVAANDRISDTQSCCLVEETAMLSSSSHLSLDLTIAFPSPRQLALVEVKPKPTSHEFTNTRNMDNESAPTLLLFQ